MVKSIFPLRDGWMDGASNGKASTSDKALEALQQAASRRASVFAALQAAGVRGANADHLANVSSLTVEEVQAESRRIKADPDVSNPPAALVRLLAKRYGLTLRGRERPRRDGPVDAGLLALQRQIEARRSQQRPLPIAHSIGDIVSRMLPPPSNP